MKIAMLGHKRIPSREGGVEVVVEELSTRMVAKGHEVICYNRKGKNVQNKTEKTKKINEYKGVKIKTVFTIDKKGLAAMTASFFATMRILFSKAEVVHYHAEGPCAWMWIIRKFSKKRVIATIHGLDWQRAKWGGFATKYIKHGEKIAVKYADEIIVLSKNVQDYFLKEYNRKTVFIPNGISKPDYRGPSIIKEKYKIDKDNYILFLGRIVPEKGIKYLIEAYKNIKTNKKLVIAGGASDTDSFYQEIKKAAEDNNNIIFTGFVHGEELNELYTNCYIYCLPSDLEGMPLSLLEAMSYGNCCLTSDIPECATVIEKQGFTFKKSDVEDLTKVLQDLCNNSEKVNKYKEKSQKYILEKYDWEKVVNQTLELYKDKEKNENTIS